MASYYIQTQDGPKGPYGGEVIRRGLREGRVPPTAQLQDVLTGRTFYASELGAEAAPQDSGPAVLRDPYAPRPAAARYDVEQPQYPAYPAYPAQQAQAPYPSAYPAAQPYGTAYPGVWHAPMQTSALAVASLVLTLATLVSCLPTCIGGVICGSMALKETWPPGNKSGRGMALWGLWLGVVFSLIYLGFVALVVIGLSLES